VTGSAAAPALGGFPAGALVAAAIFLLTYLVLGLGARPPQVSQAAPRARVGSWEYARVGAPITLLTLAWGTWWLR
jgi:hypothetical protein